MSHPETEADADFLIGLGAIRAELKKLTGQAWSERRTQWLLETGVIPAGRLGGRVCAKRQAILAVLEAASTEPIAPRRPQPPSHALEERGVNLLQCKGCGQVFDKPSRGRPPLRCPTCRAARRG